MNPDTPPDSPPADQLHPSAKLPEFNQPAPAGLAWFSRSLAILTAYLALYFMSVAVAEPHARLRMDVLVLVSMVMLAMSGTIMAFDPRTRKHAYRLLAFVVVMVVVVALSAGHR